MKHLSKPQEAIYYEAKFYENSSINSISGDVFWKFSASVDDIKEAIIFVLNRFDIFHTRIIEKDGIPMQFIQRDNNSFEIPVLVFESQKEYKTWVHKEYKKSIDVFGKLFDLFIIDVAGNIGVFCKIHHIIADATSFVLINKLLTRYLCGERDIPMYSYDEYLDTEKEYENSKRYERDRKYWLNEYNNCEINLYSSIIANNNIVARKKFSIDKALTSAIKTFCQKHNISEYIFILSILGIHYNCTTGKDNFFIGTPVLNRFNIREENMLGTFVNLVPISFSFNKDSTYLSICLGTSEKILSAFRHQRYSYMQLVKETSDNKHEKKEKLYDFTFSFLNIKTLESTIPHWFYNDKQAESMVVQVDEHENDGCYNICYSYQIEKFTERQIDEIHNSVCSLIKATLINPEQKISQTNISPLDEHILFSFNATEHIYDIPDKSTLYSLFDSVAEANNDKACIRFEGKETSFGEFRNKVEALDCRIREITEGKKSIVAVICERSLEMYTAIYGTIRGGNAYLPIDPDYPQDRIDYILENSNAAVVLAQDKFTHLAGSVPCINMTELVNNAAKNTDIPSCVAEEDDTAYVIYTSGSTGNPKGAKVSHKSAVNRILWMHDKYPLLSDDVILQKTPYTFDVSVWEHFWWGIIGGCLAPSKPGEHFLPAKILDEVFNNKVTHLHFVPSVFELFLNYLETHKNECIKFSSVKYVFLSGEALSANLIKRFYELFDYDKVTLHNLYGPTECAVDVTYYDCSPADIDPVPIGKPIYNTQMYVVDKYLNPVPVGVTGELCICGVNVGQGYLNNEKLTNEKFIDNPFGEGKLYKTGDLAYWREDGNIGFVGRIDNQIKLNGQRIEIGEIESVINAIEFVETVAVIVKKVNGTDTLVAFYTGSDDNESEIRNICSDKLPKYMVPSAIVHLDALPLNQSGKLDKKMLSQMQITVSEHSENAAPINDTEKFICEAFEKALGVSNVGRNTDFFDIGGTSLSMITILSESVFEDISASEFMRNSTPAKLAKVINEKTVTNFEYLEPLYLPANANKAIILLPFAGGGSEAFSNLVASLKQKDNNIAIYFIRYLHSFKECEEASQEIAKYLGNNEIRIYSHCVGSALAMQILNNLESNNIQVKHYFAGASIPPAKPSKKNLWNITPDRLLEFILSKAGAHLNALSGEKLKNLLKNFRKDTDFANICYCNSKNRISVPMTIIISTEDIFTKNYKNAEKLWSKYFSEVKNICFIDTKNHYFQTRNPNEVVEIILSE